MKSFQGVALVDPSEATREPLRNLLLGIESVKLKIECPDYQFFLDRVRQSRLDVAVVALDAGRDQALQLMRQLMAELPKLSVVAVSGRADGQTILQALRAGAKEFLTRPVMLDKLRLALERLRLPPAEE